MVCKAPPGSTQSPLQPFVLDVTQCSPTTSDWAPPPHSPLVFCVIVTELHRIEGSVRLNTWTQL